MILSGLLLLAAGGAAAAAPEAVATARAQVPGRDGLVDLVTRVSDERGIDARLVHALVTVESGYDPRAVSRKGALGLMQLMPDTVRRLGVRDPFDPEQNVRAGVRELARLIDRYAGDLPRALAAYNAGEGAVAKYRGIPPYRETRGYVSRIMTLYTGRKYELPGLWTPRPVLLLHAPGSGQAVISNSGMPKRARSDRRALAGGFGR